MAFSDGLRDGGVEDGNAIEWSTWGRSVLGGDKGGKTIYSRIEGVLDREWEDQGCLC